jgi:hypothetical protein
VTKDESSEARNGAAAAISSAFPKRSMADAPAYSGAVSELSGAAPAKPVKIMPGQIELTRMFSVP